VKGGGVILDSHYRIQQEMHIPRASAFFNMHEFNIIEDGRAALTVTSVPVLGSIEALPDVRHATAWLSNEGFQETDLRTDKVLFDWKSLDHIDVSASKMPFKGGQSAKDPWDWL
jgi:hypothetical protein